MSNDKSAEEIVRGRIEAIKARCEVATPGPWYVNDDNEGMPQEYSPFWVISGDSPETYDGEWYMELHCGRHPDAQFIAASREDIPYLLARVAELEARLTASQQETRAAVEDLHRMHSLCMDVGGCCPECGDQIDTLMDGACDFCKKSGVNCWVETPGDESKCAAFEWRGPQEAGEESR